MARLALGVQERHHIGPRYIQNESVQMKEIDSVISINEYDLDLKDNDLVNESPQIEPNPINDDEIADKFKYSEE